MTKQARIIGSATFILGILTTGGLIYNMLAIWIYREEVFIISGTLEPPEYLILAGFLLIPVFNILSLIWVSLHERQKKWYTTFDTVLLIMGAVCIVLLFGEKVMVDEIAREYRLGWETLGEWLGLYFFLSIQLAYNALVFRHLSSAYRTFRV